MPKLGRISSIDFFSKKNEGVVKSKNLVDIDRINSKIVDQVYNEHVRKKSITSIDPKSRGINIFVRHRYNESE